MKPENVAFIVLAIWLLAATFGGMSSFRGVSTSADALEWAEGRNN